MARSPDPFTPISELGEFGLIERLQAVLAGAAPEGLVQGIGDDAAVYRVSDGRVHVVTTDALVEGVHFDRTFTPLRYLGWKAISVNVSDVAAMNALPRYATVALGLPNNVSVEGVETLYGGMREACVHYGLAVVGGDVTAAARLTLSVTVIGEADEADVVYRRGAQPGDILCVTGDLGSAAAGLRVLLAGKQANEAGGNGETEAGAPPSLADFAYVVERQLFPQARLDRVRDWKAKGVHPHALIDVSDGLASEVHHLCRESAVGAVVEAGLLPIHVQTFRAAERFGEAPLSLALYGGEDYELLFALPASDREKLDADTFAVVGQVVEPEAGIALRLPEGEVIPLEARGFAHF